MEKSIDRRSFLKGALATSVVATTGVTGLGLSGCAARQTGEADTSGGEGSKEKIVASETLDTQVVICGGGISGLAAAVQAGQSGLDAVLIDSNSEVGGNGVGVEGIFAVGSAGQLEQGIKIDPGAVVRHEIEFAQNRPSGALWNDLVSHSAENYDWLVENGVTFSGLINDYGGLFPTMHWFEGGNAGTGYVPAMKESAEALGVDIMCDTAARELITDGEGAVRGVYAQNVQGEYIQINADAVILATGGFGSNMDMIEQAGWGLDSGRVTLIGSPGHDGDGISMAVSVGGKSAIEDACALNGTRIDGFAPKSATAVALSFGGLFLWVNEDGLRCINEDFASSNMMNITVPLQVNREIWCVGSEKTVQAAIAGSNNAAAQESGQTPEEEIEAALADCPSENIFCCDTLEELAEKSGLDRDNLLASIESYNALCLAGADTQFGKDTSMLIPLTEPPYYIYRLDTALQVAIGGLDTDIHMRVLNDAGDAIEGLYAVGVDGVRLYREVYPINVGATCCANNVHSGRVAVGHVAEKLNR